MSGSLPFGTKPASQYVSPLVAERASRAANLSDLVDKEAARSNLNVLSKEETAPAVLDAPMASGTSPIARSTRARWGDKRTAADFGFVTTDTPGSTAANNAALAAMIAEINAYPDQRLTVEFKRGDRIRFSRMNNALPAMRLMTNGGQFIYESTTASRNYMFTLAPGFLGDVLDIQARTTTKFYRAVRVGNPTIPGTATVNELRVTSEDQIANRPSGGNRYDVAVHVSQGSRIGLLQVINSDYPLIFGGEATMMGDMRVAEYRASSYRCAGKLDNVQDVKIGAYGVQGRSPAGQPDPGQNGLIFAGAVDCEVRSFWIFDSPEHGVRFGGPESGTTLNKNCKLFDGKVGRAGQTGVKIWGGTPTNVQEGIELSNIDCFDCGDWNAKGGGNPAYNDFGFMLQAAKNLIASGLKVRRQDNPFCGMHGVYLASLDGAVFNGVLIDTPLRNGVFFDGYNAYSGATDTYGTPADMRDVVLHGLQVRDANASWAGVYVNEAPGYLMNNLDVIGNIRGGAQAVRWNGSGAGATEKSLFVVKAVGSGAIYAGPASSNIIVRDRAA